MIYDIRTPNDHVFIRVEADRLNGAGYVREVVLRTEHDLKIDTGWLEYAERIARLVGRDEVLWESPDDDPTTRPGYHWSKRSALPLQAA